MDNKKTEDVEAKSKAMAGELGRLFKAGKLKAMAGLMTESTNLVLLKSRRVYQGPEAIIGFWKRLKAQGLVRVKFTVKKNTLMPIDVLLPIGVGKGVYVSYDMANCLFGTYELVFRTKSTTGGSRDFFILPCHQRPCKSLIVLMVLEGI